MRKLIMLWLIGAAILTVTNTYTASADTPTYEDTPPAHVKLAQIQAILDDEEDDDLQDNEDFQDEDDLQDDLMDPNGGGDIDEDLEDAGDETTPT
jgi:hypothetical protein